MTLKERKEMARLFKLAEKQLIFSYDDGHICFSCCYAISRCDDPDIVARTCFAKIMNKQHLFGSHWFGDLKVKNLLTRQLALLFAAEFVMTEGGL